MRKGQIGILNVGAGDTKLTFDKNNPTEMIRSARIVRDMLRRGYALLVEVDDGKGGRVYTRVHDFREDTGEYIIADLDPNFDGREEANEPNKQQSEPSTTQGDGAAVPGKPPAPEKTGPGRGNRSAQPGRGKRKAIHASTTSGIAVSRSAGG